MTVEDIYHFLNEKAPFSTAEEWDNTGLLVGDPQREVARVLTVLDITPDAVEAAQRLGAYLCMLLQDGTKSASLSCSRLAKQLDMGRASLYRALDSLAACGAIERNGKQIRLLDPAKCMDPPREAESQKKTAKETKREG